MSKIILLGDSLCDLPKNLVEENQIKIIPLGVSFKGDETVYKDGIDITKDLIFDRVEKTKVLPSTSAIAPQEFIEAFEEALKEGDHVFYIACSSGISSTHRNAILASEEVGVDKVTIIDSLSLSTGIGLLLLKARKYIDEGKSIKEIKTLLEQHVQKLSVKFAINELDYLYKGGRCSSLSFIFGRLLHIHPLIRVTDGKLNLYSKPRGVFKKALKEQIDEFLEDLPNIDPDTLFITHTCQEEDGDYQYVYDVVSQHFPKDKIKINTAGATISSHCGPRTLGILYLLKI